jgi:hypothetical protein
MGGTEGHSCAKMGACCSRGEQGDCTFIPGLGVNEPFGHVPDFLD